jgi:hypothetical protein
MKTQVKKSKLADSRKAKTAAKAINKSLVVKISTVDRTVASIMKLIEARPTPAASCTFFDRGKKLMTWGDISLNHLPPSVHLEVLIKLEERMVDLRKLKTDISRGALTDKIMNDSQLVNQSAFNKTLAYCENVFKNTKNYNEGTIGCCLLLCTGRRTSEVFGDMEFTPDYFIGSLKGGEDRIFAEYLVDFKLVQKGLAAINRRGEPSDINKRISMPLLRATANLGFKFRVRVHDLRALYAAYFYKLFIEEGFTTGQALEKLTLLLGHKESKNDRNYMAFEVVMGR